MNRLAARSAARGFGDGAALDLFADLTCTTRVATAYHEVPFEWVRVTPMA